MTDTDQQDLIHFDEIEAELESHLLAMLKELGRPDDLTAKPSGFFTSTIWAETFMLGLRQRNLEFDSELVQQHFAAIVDEYDKVDMAVSAKVEDQTPELGVQALLSEHMQPIMQMLQEREEGYSSGA